MYLTGHELKFSNQPKLDHIANQFYWEKNRSQYSIYNNFFLGLNTKEGSKGIFTNGGKLHFAAI